MKVVGALLGSMSGSMGGLTASRNRGGQYFRQRVIPTNPGSARQASVRGYLAGAVVAWTSTLTAANRTSWTTYAANTPRTGPLGTEVVLTGQQAYIGAFVPRAQMGVTVPATGPTLYNRGEPVAGIFGLLSGDPNVIGTATGNLSVALSMMNATDDDGDVLMYIGKPVGPGVNYYKGPYQLATFSAVASASTGTTLTGAIADLTIDDGLTVGQRRPVRLVMAYDDGRTSEAFQTICEVVADA